MKNKVVSFFDHIICPELLPKSPVIIDAGANQGNFIKNVVGLFENPRFIAVECQKGIMPVLIKNVKDINCEVVEAALVGLKRRLSFTEIVGGEKSGETYRYNEWGNIYDYNTPANKNIVKKNYSVNGITLSEIFDTYKLDRVDYLKMDIEGAEQEVIENLDKSVADKISQISLEFHSNKNLKNDISIIINKLTYFGFKIEFFTHDEVFAWKE